MTTGLTYTTYVNLIAELMVVDPADTNYLGILPQMITYAENRMCRDLDFLQFTSTLTGNQLSTANRRITVTAGSLVICDQINVIYPAGTSDPDQGKRIPLLPVTKEFLDMVCGDSTVKDVPRWFCPFDDNVFLVGPQPDQAYYTEIIGVARPDSLSATNTATFISTYLPDLFTMASMVYASGYQRNFGRQNDDPQMAVSYESQYQTLLKGAGTEEARKKFEASGWSSQGPAPVASPTRG